MSCFKCSGCGFESLAHLEADLCEECHRILRKYPSGSRKLVEMGHGQVVEMVLSKRGKWCTARTFWRTKGPVWCWGPKATSSAA